jgi:pimeloyl-ACP methyl ester carboxylesterase
VWPFTRLTCTDAKMASLHSELHASRYRLSRERVAGYQQALEQHHCPSDALGIFQVAANTPEAGASAARQLLTSQAPPTAIVTDSDQLALGALQAAQALGLAVPRQLSVVGTDDVPGAAHTIPALTTVQQPFLARAATPHTRTPAHRGREGGNHRAPRPSGRASLHFEVYRRARCRLVIVSGQQSLAELLPAQAQAPWRAYERWVQAQLDQAAAANPALALVWLPTGHDLHLEAPEAVASLVHHWLTYHDGNQME